MLSDARAEYTPLEFQAGPVAATSTALAIRVRHASDVEFKGLPADAIVPEFAVNVTVAAGPSPDVPLAFDGVVAVPSGTLLLGDADQEDALPIEPGRYRVQVWLDDSDHAENVRIALTPADS